MARPALSSWAEPDQPLRLVEQTVAKEDPDAKALACYGLLVRSITRAGDWQEQTWLRFVDGRPVSAVTTCSSAPGTVTTATERSTSRPPTMGGARAETNASV